jgi:hypothetical protein
MNLHISGLLAIVVFALAGLLGSAPAQAQFSQQAKLVGTGVVGIAAQGDSVSLSADGNTAIVGGHVDDSGGATWVFTRSGEVWSQQGPKLIGTGAVGLRRARCFRLAFGRREYRHPRWAW